MAVANWSSSTVVKAVLLPLILVLLAVAAGASSAEDGGAVAESGGRFSETPVGRKLLGLINGCGKGSGPDYNCKHDLVGASNPKCCTDLSGNKECWDVGGAWVNKCGSCTTSCKAGEVCCSGVCADLMSDKNHCGRCGNKCRSCKMSMCGY